MPNRRKLNGKRQPRPENVPGGVAAVIRSSLRIREPKDGEANRRWLPNVCTRE